MFLGVEPSHLASVKFHGYLSATGHDHSLEGRQRHHHAVWMCMKVRCVARSIEVLEDSYTVVLPHDTVKTWVRDHGVGHVTEVHKGMVMPFESMDRRLALPNQRYGAT